MGLFSGLDEAMCGEPSSVTSKTASWSGPCGACALGGTYEGITECPRCHAAALTRAANIAGCEGPAAMLLMASRMEGRIFRERQRVSDAGPTFHVAPYWLELAGAAHWHINVKTFSVASAAEHAHEARCKSLMAGQPHDTEETASLRYGTYDWLVRGPGNSSWLVTTLYDEGYRTVAIVQLREGRAMSCRSDDAIDHMAPDERLAKHTRECVAARQKLETEARAKSVLVAETQPDPGLAVLHAFGEAVATVARARLVSRVADGEHVQCGRFRRSDGASWLVRTFYGHFEPDQDVCFVLRHCTANPVQTELRKFRGPLEDTAAAIVQAMLEESAAWRDVP